MNDFKGQIESIRKTIMAEITPLLPRLKDDHYVNIFVPYCAGIKYLEPNGRIAVYSCRNGQLEPWDLDDLPIESLTEVLAQLKIQFKII